MCDSDTRSDEIHLVITEKGRQHSATTNSTFGKVILWGYATYLEVIKMRLCKALVQDNCPNVAAFLDTMPVYYRLNYECK